MTQSRTGGAGSGGQPTRRAFPASIAGLGLAGITRLPLRRATARTRPRTAPALTNQQLAGQRVISSYPHVPQSRCEGSDRTPVVGPLVMRVRVVGGPALAQSVGVR
jgi:hypothetical protein